MTVKYIWSFNKWKVLSVRKKIEGNQETWNSAVKAECTYVITVLIINVLKFIPVLDIIRMYTFVKLSEI